MPTGYTAMIEEDGIIDARAFVKQCGRAFGMFIHQREDSLDAELRYPSEDTYYKRALEGALDDLEATQGWSAEEISQRHRKYVLDILESNERSIQRALKINSSYEAVLAKLARWNPTDEINQAVKKYALDQINMCYPASSYTSDPEISQEKWYSGHITHLESQVAYYSEQVEEEKARIRDRKKAIDNFLADLENIPE